MTVPNPVLVPVPMAPAAAEPCEAAPVNVKPKLKPPPKLVVDCARAGEATPKLQIKLMLLCSELALLSSPIDTGLTGTKEVELRRPPTPMQRFIVP